MPVWAVAVEAATLGLWHEGHEMLAPRGPDGERSPGDRVPQHCAGCRESAGPLSDREDLDEVVESSEVVWVAGEERETLSHGGGDDQQVQGSGSPGFTSGVHDGGEDPAVSAGRVWAEGERVEGGLGSLQPVLTPAALFGVVGGVWAGGEFGECDGADGDLERQ